MASNSYTGKRLLDLTISVPGLAILFPLLIVTWAAIAIALGRPVLFQQQRPGFKGRPFKILKFRTMTNSVDKQGRLRPDAERLTALGRFLRLSSLDELPELFNVLRGDLSLIGPRPLLPQYLDRYTADQARRHEVKPGITGWAQVNGRNALTWEQKFELDVWYVDNMSFWLDLKILFLTFWKVIKRDGISQPGHATMEEFQGSDTRPAMKETFIP